MPEEEQPGDEERGVRGRDARSGARGSTSSVPFSRSPAIACGREADGHDAHEQQRERVDEPERDRARQGEEVAAAEPGELLEQRVALRERTDLAPEGARR